MKKGISQKRNNRGAALVTVIVIVLFLSIITTTLLYIATSGYRIRRADEQTRVSFYSAEEPLEAIVQEVTLVASDALRAAYVDTAAEYSTYTAQQRQARFYDHFFEEFRYQWRIKTDNLPASDTSSKEWAGDDWRNTDGKALRRWVADVTGLSFAEAESGDGNQIFCVSSLSGVRGHDDTCIVLIDPGLSKQNLEGTLNAETGAIEADEVNDSIVIGRFYVIYVTENNYRTEISTDICVTAPPLNWDSSADVGTDVYDVSDYVYYINWSRQ